jgi:thiol-disulfide isomerase/thioredoxin
MKTILGSMLLLVASICASQSKQVTIIGNMPQQFGGEYVSFSKPIGKYTATLSYINSKDTAVIKKDRFIKTLDVLVPGLIYVYEKPFNGISSARFFAEPGDTIVIERQKGEIIFKGKNAVVNKMYNDFNSRSEAFSRNLYDVFKNNTNTDNIISKINEKEKTCLNAYNDLFLKEEMSKSCLEYSRVEIEQGIYSQVMNVVLYDDFREEFKITKDDAIKIADYFNLKYASYKEENLRITFFRSPVHGRALYLEGQSLKQNKKITRFWNQFDTIFKSETEKFGIKSLGTIDYIPSDDYKESYVGQFFLDLIKGYDNEKTIKYKDLVMVYKAYVEKFPNSPYIIPLSEGIMTIGLNNSNTATPNIKKEVAPKIKVSIGNLALYGTALEAVGTAPFAQPNQSLAAAIAKKFPNQDFFVDLWATWCGPCIMQFPYNKDLHSFLETKNIKTLYVSFDKEEDKAKWGKYIQDYKLTGYHFLANKAYQKKFLDPLSPYIPRYFVYNSKTKKLKQLEEGFPKEKEIFYAKIEKALLTK